MSSCEEDKSRIINVLNRLNELGIIDSVNMDILDKIINDFKKTFANSQGTYSSWANNQSDLIRIIIDWYLSRLNITFSFDPELSDYQEGYRKIVRGLIKISDGILNDAKSEVVGELGERPTIKITFNNKKYQTSLESFGDCVDTGGLISFLNGILKNTKEKRKFYIIEAHENSTCISFLTIGQCRYLRKTIAKTTKETR